MTMVYAAPFTGVYVYAAPFAPEPEPFPSTGCPAFPFCPIPAPAPAVTLLTAEQMRQIIREELERFDREKKARKRARREKAKP
jgi:hypothetical protein